MCCLRVAPLATTLGIGLIATLLHDTFRLHEQLIKMHGLAGAVLQIPLSPLSLTH